MKMTKEKRDPNALYCDDKSMTKQSFAEECDVNEILRRAQNGQPIISERAMKMAQYGDFTNVPDYRESLNVVTMAQQAFMELPWEMRERFGNDPAKMVAFLQKEENRPEAEKLGLVTKKEKPATPAGDPATPASAA